MTGSPQRSFWSGEVLKSPIAFDTETRVIDGPLDVPELALMVASDGERHALIHPGDVPDFCALHKRHKWYGYNVKFDFWVLDAVTDALWDVCDQDRLVCLRLLRRLVKLAAEGVPERSGTLADACSEYGVDVPDKSDPYRLRYGELIGLSKQQILDHPEAEGFLSYALADAVATHALIRPLEARANLAAKRHARGVHPGAVAKWGPLSACLQTKADIVLDHLSRQPLRLDTAKVAEQEERLRLRLAELDEWLEQEEPGIWHLYKRTGLRKISENGLPKMNEKALKARLTEEASGKPLVTPTGEVSKSSKDWRRALPESEFVKNWDEYTNLKKRLSTTIAPMKGGVVYANYETLLRTGRTSASKHKQLASIPIQQIPRDNAYRTLFLADEGCLRITIDYSYLELRTLAACCLARFGFSKMAEAIREHTRAARAGRKDIPDPHQLMASRILGLSVEEFFALPPGEQKKARQQAKAANFGFPGGLGVKRFVEYASQGYGVTFSEKQAKRIKEVWYETYPEMRLWLGDNTLANLAANLGCAEAQVTRKFGRDLWHVRNVLDGYEEDESVLEKLRSLNRSPEVAKLLSPPGDLDALSGALLTGWATTPTGRVRGRVGYCDGANTPFQGLASDGAKVALWRLLYAGYNVKAFVHDEVLVDVPAAHARSLLPRIHSILDSSMESVMLGDIPCMSESHVGPTWIKG